ncbi:hypothetical protein ACLB2K_047602 [Fragaria x ananassa]
MGSAVWNETLVDVLCDLCIKEVEKNNRPNTHLNKDGWENVLTNFHKETDLKGKETGLGWDHRLHTIDASDESWSGKIKDNKEYAKLRKKGIHPNFEEKLDRMFKETSATATGMYAYIPGASLHLPESPKQGDNQQNLEESFDSDDTSHPAKRRKGNAVGKGKGVVTKPGRVGGAALSAQKIGRMCKAIESRSRASYMINKSVETSDDTSINEVMKVVGYLPGAEQDDRRTGEDPVWWCIVFSPRFCLFAKESL